jgi:cell division protein FtsL
MNQNTIEVFKLISSFLTPLAVIFIGYTINKNVERAKATIVKEKEWQVRWAELFLDQAIEFNKNVSTVVASLYALQSIKENSEASTEIIKQLTSSNYKLAYADWDIRNFAQFAKENNEAVIEKQQLLIAKLSKLIKDKKGSLEEIRQIQFEYNLAVRKAHNEILNAA